MKYLLTLFLLFFVNIGWCIKVTSTTSSPVNLLKNKTATFELWDSTPTSTNLTDENFTNYEVGIGTVTTGTDTDIGNIIYDLGATYNNIILTLSFYVVSSTGETGYKIFTSPNGTDWTDSSSNFDTYTNVCYLLPISTRYIKLDFNMTTTGIGMTTIRLYEVTATQYK